VREYALTYPQLVAQARVAGADDAVLERLRDAYATSQTVFDGYFRSCGEPFACHMVRTASVVLTENEPLPVVEAALLHSAYDLWQYEDTTRRRPRASHRRWLQRRIGPEAEALVWGFRQLDWRGALRTHGAGLADAPGVDRGVLMLDLANEVANHLDLGAASKVGWPLRERIETHGKRVVALARTMELPVLADELSVVFKECLAEDLPALVKSRGRPYEMPARRPWQARSLGRQFIRARRRVGRRARRWRTRSTASPVRP